MSSSQMMIAAVESPAETLERLNALAARRVLDRAQALQNLCHGRLLHAIRTNNLVKQAKEQSRYECLRDAKWRALEAWLDLPRWHTAEPKRRKRRK